MNADQAPSISSIVDEPRSRLARRLSVAAMFGLDPRPRARRELLSSAAGAAAAALHGQLHNGAVAVITGPSGSGKSSVVGRLAAAAGDDVFTVAPTSTLLNEHRPCLDLLRGALTSDLRLLCACGLAEAPLWLRPARLLSDGQRSRLALAVALAAIRDARPLRPLLIADEFASSLDRTSAMALCAGVRRLLRSSGGVRMIAASAHDDIVRWLEPDVVLRLESGFGVHGRFFLGAPRRCGSRA